MIKLLRADEVWQPRLGAPRGNRNALKSGRHDRATRDLCRRVAACRRRARTLMAQAQAVIALSYQYPAISALAQPAAPPLSTHGPGAILQVLATGAQQMFL